MSVNNGDIANASTFNNAFVSRSASQNVAGVKEFDTIALTAENNSATGDVVALSYTKNNIRVASANSILGIASAASSQILSLTNVSGGTITIGDQSASASAANRIVTGLGQNYTLNDGATCFLLRDVTSSVWRVLNSPAEGSNGGRLLAVTTYITSSTYTKATNNPNYVIIECVGGGGGGGGVPTSGASEAAQGAGGGGGAYSKAFVLASALSASETVTVGAGGAGGAAGDNDGSNGSVSSFGSHCTAPGGFGGAHGNDTTGYDRSLGGLGGSAGVGDISIPGTKGGDGIEADGRPMGQNFGGSSHLSGMAITSDSVNDGADGVVYGGGGAGANNKNSIDGTARPGGDGADGVVIVWEYS